MIVSDALVVLRDLAWKNRIDPQAMEAWQTLQDFTVLTQQAEPLYSTSNESTSSGGTSLACRVYPNTEDAREIACRIYQQMAEARDRYRAKFEAEKGFSCRCNSTAAWDYIEWLEDSLHTAESRRSLCVACGSRDVAINCGPECGFC